MEHRYRTDGLVFLPRWTSVARRYGAKASQEKREDVCVWLWY